LAKVTAVVSIALHPDDGDLPGIEKIGQAIGLLFIENTPTG